jgi:hypothetical protein
LNATQLTSAVRKPALFIPERIADRARSRSILDPDSGCLISTYSVGSHGYSQIGWHTDGVRIVTLTHRVVWASQRGPIPDGMTVDHMCKTRKCVNIDHLRLLSNFENARRTSGRDWELGKCVNGHSNSFLTQFSNGKTGCSLCAKWLWKHSKGQRPRRLALPKPPKAPPAPKTHCRNGHEWIADNIYIRPNGRRECMPCKQEHAKKWHGYSTAA